MVSRPAEGASQFGAGVAATRRRGPRGLFAAAGYWLCAARMAASTGSMSASQAGTTVPRAVRPW